VAANEGNDDGRTGWDQHRYLVIWNDLNDVETLHVITVARKLVPSEEPFRAHVHAPRRLGQGEDEVSGEKVVTALAVDRVRVDQHVGEGGCRVSDIRAPGECAEQFPDADVDRAR